MLAGAVIERGMQQGGFGGKSLVSHILTYSHRWIGVLVKHGVACMTMAETISSRSNMIANFYGGSQEQLYSWPSLDMKSACR